MNKDNENKIQPQILKTMSAEHNVEFDCLPEEVEEELDYPDAYHLPILFSIDKANRERMWKNWVVGNVVHRLQGLTQGKKQTYERSYTGKNIGKKNETTPEEQAQNVADVMWTKQIDKGYFPKCKEGKSTLARMKKATSDTGGHNINAAASIRGRTAKTLKKKSNYAVSQVQIPIKPMKANKWDRKDTNDPLSVLPRVLKYFDFDEGVYLQWKLDGWRCVVRLQYTEGGAPECVMTTNNGKQYPWFAHLRKEIIRFVSGKEELVLDGLDGELYTHRIIGEDGLGLDDEARFSMIQSMCGLARSNPHPLETQMNFVVFDLVDKSGKLTQDERFANLKKLFKNAPNECTHIQMCETKVATFIEEVGQYHDEVAQKGYEGVIIRSRDLTYLIGKRSLKIRKYKYFIDREYTIVDVEKDEGVKNYYFVWVCETEEGKRFKATPMGCQEDKEWWYENYLEFLGKQVTLKFQGYSEDGVPRFPIAKGIREDQ